MQRLRTILLIVLLTPVVGERAGAQVDPEVQRDINEVTQRALLQQKLLQQRLLRQGQLQKRDAQIRRQNAPNMIRIPARGAEFVEELPALQTAARSARMKAHAAAFQDWAARTCDWSDQQHKQLDELLAEKLRVAQASWTQNTLRPSGLVPEQAPILFTRETTTWNYLHRGRVVQMMKEVLTNEQRTELIKALDERRTAIRRANLWHIVSLLDHEIHLTPEQRGPVAAAVRARIGRVHHRLFDLDTGLYAFGDKQSLLRHRSLDVLLSGIAPDVLTADQQAIVLNHLTSRGRAARPESRSYTIVVSSGEESGSREQEQVAVVVAEERERFAEAVKERVATLAATLSLSEQQKRLLTVAGIGATERCLTGWRRDVDARLANAKKELARAEFAGIAGDVPVRTQGSYLDAIDKDELWQHTIEKIQLAATARPSRPFERESIAGYVCGMLDKELWLTPDQRQPLTNLVHDVLPEAIQVSQPQVRELEFLVIALFRIPERDISVLLTEPQQAVWKTLREQFERDADTVALKLTHGRRIEFELPGKSADPASDE